MDNCPATDSPGGPISVGDRGSNLTDPERGKLLLEQLRAGYAPSTVEADELQNSIAQAKSYRNLLDGEISSLNEDNSALLDRLATKKTNRDAVEKAMSIQSALLSPIRRLPRELFLEIFDQACPQNDIPIQEPIDDCPSLVLSHTCRSWRELAFSSPKLWSRFRIGLTLTYPDDSPYERLSRNSATLSTKPYLAEMYLRLSKDHPLEIIILEIDISQLVWAEVDDVIERDKRTLSLLVDNAWRWRSFNCHNTALTAVPEPIGNFPHLREVEINYGDQNIDENSPPEPSWLTRARNTETLTISSPSYPLIPLAWAGIKHLTVVGDSDDGFSFDTSSTIRSFLSHLSLACPNLKEFDWIIPTNDASLVDPSSFDQLTCLRVGGYVNLDWIIAPDLQHLDASELKRQRRSPRALTRFIQTSGAVLTSIEIGRGYLRNKRFWTSFKSMENLLHLICTSVGQSALRSLFEGLDIRSNPDDVESVQLPRLRTLTLYWQSDLNVFYTSETEYMEDMVIDDRIVKFLESRRSQSPLCFERFSVLTSGEDIRRSVEFKCESTSCKERLRQLRTGGLSLCFNGDWSPVERLACDDEEK